MAFSRLARRLVSRAAAVTLLVSAATAGITATAPSASASGTVLFNQPFNDNTVDGSAGSLSLPAAPTGANVACLSAAGNATKNPLASCSTSTDAQGSGKLRLTPVQTSDEGGVFANTSVPTSQGLDVTFNSYQYGGNGADGIAFVLAGVNPASPAIPSSIGQSGGALGYSSNGGSIGLSYGYMGFGLDAYGNYSNHYEGSGCTDPANISTLMPGQVVVRGPGNGTVGYCALQSSAATATSPQRILRAATRAASLVPVEVVFNPTSASVTTASGLVVPAGDYNITFTPVGGTATHLVGALPVVPSGLYPSTWVSSNGIPKQLVFGWVASTGGSNDAHEIDNVVVSSINQVPQLAVSQTSYAAATLTPGSPVTYTVAATSSGAAENQPVTVTETLPAGVLPVGASGTGWVCAAPSGQQISCTNSTSPFTSGTITVNGVVTSSSVTPALVQSGTSAVASSSDASPATSSSAPAGTVPAAPTVTGITPTNGAAGGVNDVKITGTGLGAATAIEIGTTAQFTAGTPTMLALCAASAPGCFTVVSSTSLDISSMPGHTAGAVTVEVVTLGTSASTAYTYNSGPALLFAAPPGGEVGVSYSDQLTVTGGTSPFTWSVSTGSLPAGVTLNASTGLLAGTPTTAGSYSFTVKVTDSSGLTSTEPVTVTIIPAPSLSFPAPPAGWTNTVYGDTLTESGGTSPFTWSVSSGSLPAGISLSADGNLSGTPTATGTSSFTVKVTDANGQSATEATSIGISAGVSTTFSAPPAAPVNSAYSDTLTATGGTTPYTWSLNSGTLPAGITLSSAGVLSGTPTTTGSYPFTVNVIDANKGIATASITLAVTAAVTLTFSAPPNGTVGTAYSDTLTAAGGTTPYTWSVSAGTLPAGITLNASTGVLSGTPTAAGTSSFTVKVTDAKNTTATFATSITILGSMVTIAMTASTTTATPGSTVTYTITATNTGQLALTGATFTDSLSDVLDDATYNGNASATAGSVAFTSPNLTWTGNLALNASATITFSVTVASPDTGNKSLAAAITSTTATSNCASGSTDTRCSSTVGVSVLTIAMTASTTSTTPAAVVGYTITVTNSGQVAYTGAALADSLSGVLDDASYNSDATATAGSVTFSSPNLTWTGNLAAGASATITFSVTVASPDTGDKNLASTVTSATAGSNCASGSTDTRCASTVTVLVPGLTIAVSANASTATPGSVVHYTVTLTNSGQTAYTGAAFTDPLSGVLDDASYNNDAAATAGSVSYASPTLSWTGNLAVGASATVTFSVTVTSPDNGDKVLASTITSATTGSNCASGSTDTRCASAVSVLVPGLTIAVSAGSATTTPGAVVHYTMTVTNSGQTAYTGATAAIALSGVLDDAAYNHDASATAGSVAYTSPTLTWTGNLAVGATATVTYSVTVASPDTGDKVLASTVTSAAAGSNCASGSTDTRCASTVNVAVLTITTTSSVATTTPGSVVRFTLTFVNSGQVAYTGITIGSNITDLVDDATPNGDQTATSGTVTVTATGFAWTGSIPVGGTVTVTGTVTVNSPDTGNKVLASTLTTTAAGSNCPAGSTDPRCSSSVTVLTPALTISTSANVTAAAPGQQVTVTVTIADSGQTPYSGAVVTDSLSGALDDAAYDNDAAATAGSVAYTSPNLTWTGNLAVGASAVITYTMTVSNPDTGDKVIINTATSAATGSTCPPSATTAPCRVTVAGLTPALTITSTAGSATAVPGGTVSYTVTIADTGQTAYTGATAAIALSGVLDDAAYNHDASATAGSVAYTSPTLTWTGNLAVGATATITYSATVNNPDTGDKVLASTVTSAAAGSNCASGSTDTRCASTVNVAVLTITTTSSVATTTPGSVVRFTLTFVNSGQVAYTGITIGSNITDLVDDATPNGDQTATSGTVTVTATGFAWTGSIPVGGTVTVTGTVTVNSPDTGNKVLASTLTTTAAGSNCPAGSTDPRCSSSVTVLTPALTISTSANVTAAAPGQQVTVTVTIADSGQTPYSGAVVTDSLSGALDDAAYDNDAAATAGSVAYTSPNLTWTGNLAVGASAVINYTMTVSNPDTGDKVIINTATSAATGSTCPPSATTAPCRVTVAGLTPALTITSTAGSATAVPGGTVSYTVTIADTGQTAYTGATAAIALSGVLDDAAYNHDASATAGSVAYTSPTLTWTGNLAVGATATVTYSVTVASPDTGDKVLASTVTSAAAGSNCASGSTDTRCASTVNVAVLTITTTSSVATTTPGSVVRFTLTFVNSGQVAYTGITIGSNITDLVDDATPNGDQTATSGTVTVTATGFAWTGSIPVGGTVTVTGTVTVNSPDTGNKVLASTLTTTAAGSNCPAGSTDPRCSSSVTVLTPALTISTSANVTAAAPGQQVTVTVTIADSGQTPYSGAVVTDSLSGALDDAAYDNDAAATAGSVAYTSPNLTWTGNLAVGASAVITYTMTVSNPDTGDKVIINTATSAATGSTCPPSATTAPCRVTVAGLTPALTITSTAGSATAVPGGTVSYTVTIADTGQTAYTGATAAIALSGVLDDAAYNHDASATAGAVSYTSPTLTWTGNLAVGATATITYSATVNNPDTGNDILASTVTSAAAGSNCASGSTDTRCASTVNVAVLTIVNTASVATTTPGSVVRFTTTFVNSGQVAYTGITIGSNITDVADDATPDGDQTATSGTLTLTATGISWTGSIAVGGTVTVTGTVTVNSPDTGNKVLAGTFSSTAPGNNCPSGSTDPRCSFSVTVLIPALTITQTSNAASAVPGQQVGFTVTIADTGQTPYTGATVTDTLSGMLDDAVYGNDAATTAGSVSYASQVLTWTGNLAVGASATITFSATVNNPDTGDKLLAGTMAATGGRQQLPPASGNPGCGIVVPVLTPALTITKTASTATATPGQQVTYTITVTDSGQTSYTGAAFTDPLSGVLADAAYNHDAAATAGSVSFSSPNLTWTGNLAPGASATITYSVMVNNPDTGTGTLANTVTSATPGSNCPAGAGDSRCAVTVTIVGTTTLSFTQSTGASSTTAGSTVHYTVTVGNSGQSAYSNATFTDPLSGVLDDASYNSDASATAGSVAYASSTLTWTGTVPATGTVTVTFSVTVASPDTGNQILASTVTSSSANSNCASGSTDPRCASTVTVSQLTIVNSASVSSTTPGSVVRFTSTYTNTGQTPYTGIMIGGGVADINDDATGNGDQTATSGLLVLTQTGIAWTGDIPVGGSVTVTGTVTVNNPDTGNQVLASTLSTTAAGSNCPSGSADSRCSFSVPVLTPALSIVTSANTASAVPGQQVSFTVTVSDTGQTPYTGATVTDSLAGALGDAAYNHDAAATAGSVSYASPVLTWTGNLAVGASAVITYTMTVSNPDTGDKALINTSASTAAGSTCPPNSPNAGCSLTVPVLTPALTITSTAGSATAVPGGTVSYTVTIADTGQTAYTGATAAIALSGVLDDAAYNHDASATAGAVSHTSPTLTWTGNLAVGATATITYSATVNNPDTGNDILASTVTSAAAGSNCASGSTDPRCASTVTVSQLTIVNTANVATTTPGSVVLYTATLTNTGQTPYYGITMSSDGSGIVDDANSNGDETASSGTFSIGATGAVWTGDIPVGATVTLTGSVTVNNPDTGDHILTAIDISSAPGSNCPSGSTDSRCRSIIDVLTPALSIVTSANTASAVPGQQVSFTVTIADSGQTPYTGATVTDSLAGALGDAAYNHDAAVTAGSVSYASPVLTWTGNLAVGASAVITYTMTVSNPDTGDKALINTSASTAAGSGCPPNSPNAGCSLTVPVLTPALTITSTAGSATAVPGGTVSYTVTIADTGQTAYTGATAAIALSGVLDDAAYNHDASATAGAVSYTSPTLTWTGNLAVGATATITYSATVNSPDTGNDILASTVTSAAAGSNCPSGSTDPRCASTVTVSQLIIVNSASVSSTTPGSVVRITATYTNTGQTPYTGITVLGTGDLPADSATNGDQTATSGSLVLTQTGIAWTGDIPVGGTVTITGTVTVDNPDTGNQVLASTLSTTAAGSNCPSGSTDPRCSFSVPVLTPALSIVTTANTASAVPGQQVSFTVTIADSGRLLIPGRR